MKKILGLILGLVAVIAVPAIANAGYPTDAPTLAANPLSPVASAAVTYTASNFAPGSTVTFEITSPAASVLGNSLANASGVAVLVTTAPATAAVYALRASSTSPVLSATTNVTVQAAPIVTTTTAAATTTTAAATTTTAAAGTPTIGSSNSAPPPGGMITITVQNFIPGSTVFFELTGEFGTTQSATVRAEVASTQNLGSSVANASGVATKTFAAPNVPGTFTVKATSGERSATTTITVVLPPAATTTTAPVAPPAPPGGLPATGTDSTNWVRTAVLLTLVGIGLVVIASVRRKPRVANR